MSNFRDLINMIRDHLLTKVPEPLRTKLKTELDDLEELVMDSRAPRFAILGRRGAGKSSLINAIFGSVVAGVGSVKSQTGAGAWHTYFDKRGKLEILDTRGLGEGTKPNEAASTATPLEEISNSIKSLRPDALLFLVKAKEVDSHIDEDMAQLTRIRQIIKDTHNYEPPVVGVVTQVDELDPADVSLPPFDDEEKQTNIQLAQTLLYEKISKAITEPVRVIPVSAYMRFKDNQIVSDRRWQIDMLIEYLIDQLPKSAQMELAKISKIKSVQKKMARILGSSAATIAGGVGATPIPVGDIPIITGIQIAMITGVAFLSGRELDKKAVTEFLGALGVNIGAGFIFRECARALVKFVFPGGGNAISGLVAAAATYGLCEAAIAYFIDGKSIDEAKHSYQIERKHKEQTQ